MIVSGLLNGKTSSSDTVVFYGFGGGITWEATPNFGIRVATDFVHYNYFSNLLDGGRNSVQGHRGHEVQFWKEHRQVIGTAETELPFRARPRNPEGALCLRLTARTEPSLLSCLRQHPKSLEESSNRWNCFPRLKNSRPPLRYTLEFAHRCLRAVARKPVEFWKENFSLCHPQPFPTHVRTKNAFLTS